MGLANLDRNQESINFLPFANETCLWVDGSDQTAFTLGADNLITAVRDKSPEGNHPTQSTGTKQPTLSVNSLASKSVLTFDGGDTLVLPSALYTIPNGDNTTIVVAKRNSETAAAQFITNFAESTANRNYIAYTATSGSIAFQNRTADNNILTRTGNTNTSYQIIRGRREGTTMAITVNGLAETTSANGLSESGVDGAWIGSARDTASYLTGGIAELVMWRRSLSPLELSLVEMYLSVKWGIPLYI